MAILLSLSPIVGVNVAAQEPNRLTLIAGEIRRSLPVMDIGGAEFVSLRAVAQIFRLTVRDDNNGIMASYKGNVIILVEGLKTVWVSGRLISLPESPFRLDEQLLVPVAFINLALAPIFDAPIAMGVLPQSLVSDRGSLDPSASLVKIAGRRFGSGIVILRDSDGVVVLTSSHVINGAANFSVVFSGDPLGSSFSVRSELASVHGEWLDDTYGIAIFRVRGPISGGVRAVELGEGASLKRRDALEYWGYPRSSSEVVFESLSYAAPNGRNFEVDQRLNEGASGGGLFQNGLLVGMVAATSSAVTSEAIKSALIGWGVKLPDPTDDLPSTPSAPRFQKAR